MAIETVRVALWIQSLIQSEITTCIKLDKDEPKICFDNDKFFDFDSIYAALDSQEDIFEKSMLPILKQSFEGEHVAVLAFGQTSSGTENYSIFQEMLPRIIKYIKNSNDSYQLKFTFKEQYSDDLFQSDVKEEEDFLDLLAMMTQKRNYSNKSHTVVTIQLSLNQQIISNFQFIELNGYPERDEDILLNEIITVINTSKKSIISGSSNDITTASLDSLIDTQHILVLACINPAASEYTNTLNTLTNAQRIQKPGNIVLSDARSRIIQLQKQISSLHELPDEELQSLRIQLNQLKEDIVKDPLSQSCLKDIEQLESELLENHGHLSLYYHQMTNVPSSKSSGKKVTASLSSNRRHHSSSKKKPVMYRMKSSTSSHHKRKVHNNHHQHMLELLELLNDEIFIDNKITNQPIIPPFEETSVHPTQELISPTDPIKSTEEDELEALAVPSWTDIPKTSSNQGSVKRQSISVDSMWDDTDSSVTTAHKPIARTRPKLTQSKETKRSNKSLIKMLHQVQADLLVKRELVGQLEKTEDQYTQMRSNYEQRLKEYKTYITKVQEQQDEAQKVTVTNTPSIKRAASVLELRENRQAQEVRSQYEVKLKRLIAENSELKKKNIQATQQLETTRVKSEAAIQRLKQDIEALKSDKKQLMRQLKQETDKSRESMSLHQKEIQQLKRRLVMTMDAKKKAEETNTNQAQALKKKTDDAAAVHSQLRQITLALRKVAAEGCIMNEATLDKILKPNNRK